MQVIIIQATVSTKVIPPHMVGDQPIKGDDPHMWGSRLVHFLGTGYEMTCTSCF